MALESLRAQRLPFLSRGEEEILDGLEVKLQRARGALAVAHIEPLLDALTAEGVHALVDDRVLVVDS